MPVTISTRTASASSGSPSEIDALFAVAMGGSAIPADEVTVIRSIGDYEAAGGTRASDPLTYDGLDNYFHEGGKRAVLAPKGANTLDDTLDAFTEDYGGGQVVAWEATPLVATYQSLTAHAKASKRYAIHDSKSTDDTVAKLTTTAGTLPATDADYAVAVGPWVELPAPAGVAGGATRSAPASSTLAALIARADQLGNPNRAPAGRDFPLQYATGITGPSMSDADTAALRLAGINPLREKFGLMVLDGFQTKVAPDPNDPYWQANCGRARMWLQWHALDVGLNYEYKPIDGRGRLQRALQGDLEAVCKQLWEVDGLFGDSPPEAYAVNVGVSINTPTTIAYGELHAVVEARFSLHARTVIIELVTVPITGRVSA